MNINFRTSTSVKVLPGPRLIVVFTLCHNIGCEVLKAMTKSYTQGEYLWGWVSLFQ